MIYMFFQVSEINVREVEAKENIVKAQLQRKFWHENANQYRHYELY